ncbi:MAG: hypothetical protein ACI33K_03670 [Clostridiaceae bacterium]
MNSNTTADIQGLAEEKELSSVPSRYLTYFNDRDYIKNGKGEEGILSIAKVLIKLSISSQREVYLSKEKLLFLDGEKSLTLSYTSEEGSFITKSYFLPFSTVITLDKEVIPDTINIYPLHIYPYLYNENTVYIHTHYAAAVTFNSNINNLNETLGHLNPDEESL